MIFWLDNNFWNLLKLLIIFLIHKKTRFGTQHYELWHKSLKEFTRLFRIPQFCNDQILSFPLSSHLFCFQLLYSAMIRGTSPLIWLKLLDPSNINSCISTFQPLVLLPTSLFCNDTGDIATDLIKVARST